MTDPNTKLTPADAAKRAGLSAAHLAKLRMVGGGPAFYKLGRKIMYAVGDVDAWLASKRLTKSPAAGGKSGRRKRLTASDHQSAAA